ncbi:helix-turn-helix domain-containing protein [Bradyrhizobium sp. 26S5]|uniref:helix-turn-helix domain-containing protein n=1 Tax=Bradyrhizobium sp. 26S5 TaxID=3139729 RepID=UPI0030CF3B0E
MHDRRVRDKSTQGAAARGNCEGERGWNYRGRPPSIRVDRVRELKAQGLGATEIARAMGIGRATVYRALGESADCG